MILEKLKTDDANNSSEPQPKSLQKNSKNKQPAQKNLIQKEKHEIWLAS